MSRRYARQCVSALLCLAFGALAGCGSRDAESVDRSASAGIAPAVTTATAPVPARSSAKAARLALARSSWARDLVGVEALGCAGQVRPLMAGQPSQISGDTWEQLSSGLRSRYVSRVRRIEQTLTLSALPGCQAQPGPVTLRLRARDVVSASGTRALLRGAAGQRLRYDGLLAKDARGVAQPARFEWSEGQLSIALDLEPAAELPVDVSAMVWVEQQGLSPTEESSDPSFGFAVATDGETALVSAPTLQAIEVFSRSAGSWAPGPVLRRADSSVGGLLGNVVAVSGDWIAAGSYDYSTLQSGPISLFERDDDDGGWREHLPVLRGSNQVEGDRFGISLALAGTTLVVGASDDREAGESAGAVYIFERTAGQWLERQRLLEPRPGAKSERHFGVAVALHGQRLVVGTQALEDPTAYVFESSGGTWSQVAKLQADVGSGDGFGTSVAVSETMIAVGAPAHAVDAGDGSAAVFAGAVYVFDVASGAPPEELRAPEPIDGMLFGGALAAGRNAVFVSAVQVGAAYLFGRGQAGWSMPQTFVPDEPPAGDNFGCSLAAAGDAFLVGEQNLLWEPGTAIAYALDTGAPCTADFDCSRGFCTEGVCCDSRCGDACQSCRGALNGSGSDGECGFMKGGALPKGSCPSSPRDPCGPDGLCDGAGQCRRLAPAGMVCGADACAGEVLAQPRCDGRGTCNERPLSCGAFICREQACLLTCASSDDCAAGLYCSKGECKLRREAGALCGAGDECKLGFCVDGVCCESACDGQCEFCAEAGVEGKCRAVLGEPELGRAACPYDEADPCSPSSCDGKQGKSCQAFITGNLCIASDCPSGQAMPVGRCNGYGRCACEAAVHCSDARDAVVDAAGTQVETCGSYRCIDNACATTCRTSDDCAADVNCNPNTSRCERPTQNRASGCSLAGRQRAEDGVVLGVLCFALFTRCRRRRSSSSQRRCVR